MEKMEQTIQDSILLMGNRDDVYRLYQAMDVFVLPSRYEGLPVVGVEAQANSLYCVLSSSITKEAKVTEKVVFLDIENTVSRWAETILALKNCARDETEDAFDEKYNLAVQSKALTEYYQKIMSTVKEEMRIEFSST